jgi:DNA polymerase-3 subunit delta'
MRVEDVEGPVVSAATRTPFEAARRVFVLERVETMNDEVANRLLKTLEDPPPFVHLILLTAALGRVLETVVSRCQLVRFDPLPAARIAADLEAQGVPGERALACAGLALGNATRARFLASDEGQELRSEVGRFVAAALHGGGAEPWRPLLDRAEQARAVAEEEAASERERRLELEPKGRERRALERELEEAAKRDGRRARTAALDLALSLTGLAFRDLVCLAEGAPEAVLAVDTPPDPTASGDGRRLREAAERCEDTRRSLELNVTEELALSALGFRLAALAGDPG